MNINAHTRLNAVIGNPVLHSQSPRLHQALYEEMGINAIMLAFENPSLDDYISSVRTLSIGLTAVTMPFKTDILDFVDTRSDAVNTLNAANTLLYANGLIHAENTDVDGIRAALANTPLRGKNVLIIGAGGAARAAAYALQNTHAQCYVLNRTLAHAEALTQALSGTCVMQGDLNDLPIDVIINATPIGMSTTLHDTPLPGYIFKPHQTVFDLIYTPRETRLLREANEAGAHCIAGIEMFVAQARSQVQLYLHQISAQECTA